MVSRVDPHPTNEEPQPDDEVFFIFLSHVTEVKKEVQALKEGLEECGVEAFVAHSDIHPGTEWQEEILEALKDMDAFVPVLTEGFSDSPWTDQEVGYAIASEVPIIPLRLGVDPYGFMGKYQGLSCSWEQAPREIIKALIGKTPLLVDSYIDAVADCSNFDTGNRLAEVLPGIEELTEEQVTRLIEAFNNNPQVGDSFGFNGTQPSAYGEGLVAALIKLTGYEFELDNVDGHYVIVESLPWMRDVAGRIS